MGLLLRLFLSTAKKEFSSENPSEPIRKAKTDGFENNPSGQTDGFGAHLRKV
jgi:hypothetical protein